MQITRNSIETGRGPSEWFTGDVYIDTVAAPSEGSRLSASSVHFTPGARTAWHTHPNGQTIGVTEGIGLCQRRGGPIEVIRPGDRVFFEPGGAASWGYARRKGLLKPSIVDAEALSAERWFLVGPSLYTVAALDPLSLHVRRSGLPTSGCDR